MRILIAGNEIAGWINNYKKGFTANGHEVTSAVFGENQFYRDRGDVQLSDSRGFVFNVRYNVFYLMYTALRSLWSRFVFRNRVRRLIDQNDLVIYIWRPFFNDYSDYRYLKKKGKKMICLFVGSDVRFSSSFIQEFQIRNAAFCRDAKSDNIEKQIAHIRFSEKYADLIYSVPDQSGLQLRPYNHLQVPLDVSRMKLKDRKNNDFITVLHAPSKPSIKGTDIIERTVYSLIDEGYRIKFVSIRNMLNEEVIELLSESDILIDEIVAHGPGALSFEAMACGCVVATKYLESSPVCFRPPVWNINEDNIYDRLKLLLENKALRQELSRKSIEYARKNNDLVKVTHEMLQDLTSMRDPDYYPRFLIDFYIPYDSFEVGVINKWNEFVKDCDWYKSRINAIHRLGLKF